MTSDAPCAIVERALLCPLLRNPEFSLCVLWLCASHCLRVPGLHFPTGKNESARMDVPQISNVANLWVWIVGEEGFPVAGVHLVVISDSNHVGMGMDKTTISFAWSPCESRWYWGGEVGGWQAHLEGGSQSCPCLVCSFLTASPEGSFPSFSSQRAAACPLRGIRLSSGSEPTAATPTSLFPLPSLSGSAEGLSQLLISGVTLVLLPGPAPSHVSPNTCSTCVCRLL